MSISAADVKKLRDMTGAGMMECKKALTDANGNMDEAVELLRKRGIAKAEKKADRTSSEGTVAIAVSDDNKKAALVELKCETDFVGRNSDFVAIAETLAKAALEGGAGNADELNDVVVDGKKVAEHVTQAVLKLGENIQLGQVSAIASDGFVSTYVHMNGKIGVAVAMAGDYSEAADEAGRNLAMQVAAMNPVATRRDGVPADVVAKEKEIFMDQIRQSGKPENIAEKIAEGKLNKYFSEICLVEQSYVKEQKLTVDEYLKAVSKETGAKIDVNDFVRINVGE